MGKDIFYNQFHDPNIRLIKVRPRGKEAMEKNWPTIANYSALSQEMQAWVLNGGNYGLTSLFGFFCCVDADTEEIQAAVEQGLRTTLRWSTGRYGHSQYAYHLADAPIGCIPLKDGAYVKGRGGYALGPGSVHPNGATYGAREIRETPVAVVKREEFLKALEPFLISKRDAEQDIYAHTGNHATPDQQDVQDSRITDIVSEALPAWNKAVEKHVGNDFRLAIAGTLYHFGWPESAAERAMKFLIEKSDVKGLSDKGAVHYTYANGRAGKPVYGYSTLKRLIEEIQGGAK